MEIIRCNNCYKCFENEESLEFMKDKDGDFKGCPVCKTDEYLMDINTKELG